MNASIAALAYLGAGVLFILSLRGLSSPETSRRGNTFGMVGMALAIGVTLLTLWGTGTLDGLTLGLIAAGVIVGGGVGAVIAKRVPMTAMPPWRSASIVASTFSGRRFSCCSSTGQLCGSCIQPT